MTETSTIETESKFWDYEANLLRVVSEIPDANASIDVSVFQDTQASGNKENQDVVSLSGGREQLDLTGFAEEVGAEYWIEIQFSYPSDINEDDVPAVDEISISSSDVKSGTLKSEARTWDFEAQTIETNSTLNTDTDGIALTVNQDTDEGSENDELFHLEGGSEEQFIANEFSSVDGEYYVDIEMASLEGDDGTIGDPEVDSVEIFPEGGILAGIVTDVNDTAVDGVDIIAKNQETEEIHRATTDGDGKYEFSGLEEGIYHVSARTEDVDGFYNAESKPFIEVFEPN